LLGRVDDIARLLLQLDPFDEHPTYPLYIITQERFDAAAIPNDQRGQFEPTADNRGNTGQGGEAMQPGEQSVRLLGGPYDGQQIARAADETERRILVVLDFFDKLEEATEVAKSWPANGNVNNFLERFLDHLNRTNAFVPEGASKRRRALYRMVDDPAVFEFVGYIADDGHMLAIGDG
jgi:hypothetical protein